MIRNITGIGEGKGPIICIHDGFIADSTWYTPFVGDDRICLDAHPYLAFGGSDGWNNNASTPCQDFGPTIDQK